MFRDAEVIAARTAMYPPRRREILTWRAPTNRPRGVTRARRARWQLIDHEP
jgi:hypothetical protein